MPTYAELAEEPWWNAEFEAPAHAALNNHLRTVWGHTKSQTGSKGDNFHLRGRHRSRAWDLNSRYCTNRNYATTNLQDQLGDGNWLRATDCGLSGPPLWEMCRRLDAAVRAGRLPCIAEWFGTFDGKTVVGWYEGRASSSDSSHLAHGHVGIWTKFCDDDQQMTLLGEILTGVGGMTAAEVWAYDPTDPKAPGAVRNQPFASDYEKNPTVTARWALEQAWNLSYQAAQLSKTNAANLATLAIQLNRVETKLDQLLARPEGSGGVTLEQIKDLLGHVGLAVRE